MSRSILTGALISGASSLVTSLGFYTVMRVRPRETDASGNPVVRFLAAPYIMIFCGLFFLIIGIYQWFSPLNHYFPGNLLIASYIPCMIGFLVLAISVYYFKFRVTLTNDAIEVVRWPFPFIRFALADLMFIDETKQRTTLYFSYDRKFILYSSMYSGYSYFLSRLKTASSKSDMQRAGWDATK